MFILNLSGVVEGLHLPPGCVLLFRAPGEGSQIAVRGRPSPPGRHSISARSITHAGGNRVVCPEFCSR